MARVRLCFYRLPARWRIKTWPSRTRMVLRIRPEQPLPAAYALVHPRHVRAFIFAGKRWLRPFLPRHVILIGRKLLFPFRAIFANFIGHLLPPTPLNF